MSLAADQLARQIVRGVGDDRDRRPSAWHPTLRPWARPWSPERPASSARTSRGRCSTAATRCACWCGPARRPRTSTAWSTTSPSGDINEPRAMRRALRGVDRVFHVAGLTSLRASAEKLHAINVEGTRNVLEECLRAGCRARRLHLVGGGDRPRAARGRPPTSASTTRRAAEHPLRRRQARGRGRGAALGRARAAGRDRQPRPRPRPRRRAPLLDRVRAPLPAAPDPRLRGRRAQRRRRRRRRARPPARRREGGRRASATSSATATTPSTACSPTSARISGVEPPALKAAATPWRSPSPRRPSGSPAGRPMHHRSRSAPPASGGRTATPRPSASWASSPRRTRRPSRRHDGVVPRARGDRFSRAGTAQPLPLRPAGSVIKRAGD